MIINLTDPPYYDKEMNDHWFKLASEGLKNSTDSMHKAFRRYGYISIEDGLFLEQRKSAYERVLKQAEDFMKREAKLWKFNADLLRRAEEAEREVKDLKEEVKATGPKLVLLPGGKEPPTTANCWLERFEIGTIFIIQSKNDPMDFTLGLFKLVGVEGIQSKAYILMSPSMEKPIYVNPVRFCNKYSLYDTVAVVVEPTDVSVDTVSTGSTDKEYLPSGS